MRSKRWRRGGGRRHGNRIRIKIVVDVHAIEVVAANHIRDDVERAADREGLGRVHPELLTVGFHRLGMGPRDMIRREGRTGARVAGAVGVEPRVEFEPAAVCLGDPELQRIVKRRRWPALFAGQIFRPRLQRRRVERVGRRPHLEDDRVELKCARAVEDREGLRALLLGGQAGFARPVDVGDRGDPRRAEFARCRRRLAGATAEEEGEREGAENQPRVFCRRGDLTPRGADAG